MAVTLVPITTELREEQYLKAAYPTLVTLFGIVMEVREEQRWKVCLPMYVTLLSNLITPLPFS
jgi:hypothetical protein